MAQTYDTLSNIPLDGITSENAIDIATRLAKDPSFINSGPTGAPQPGKVSMSTVKSNLLRPALSSHYQCWFNPPSAFRKWLSENKDIRYEGNELLVSLSCSEAVLPGSSMMTNEINDDYTGTTERHAYRRQYDDRADFTFYVNHNDGSGGYYIIKFFEYWLSYISGEEYALGLDDPNYSYRIRYPSDYQSPTIYVNKFEKDYAGRYLEYRLLQAYPISISSMPVSYESSQLLKCTVSFTYIRYLAQSKAYRNPQPQQATVFGEDLGFFTEQGSFVTITKANPNSRNYQELSPQDIDSLNRIAGISK